MSGSSQHAARLVDGRRALVLGTFWSVAMRWSVKLLGLLSTFVLARILTPGDYGMVGMAMLVVGLTEVLVDFGAGTALMREPDASRSFIDSAWTLGAIQGLIVGTLLALAAPLAGLYFQEPRVVAVIWIIAPCIAIGSFGNIGVTLARKQLNFALEFRFTLLGKFIGVAVTIAAALLLRDYRALVIGIVAGYLSGLVLSYLMHPYRPRWCVAEFGAMWNFSKWLLISGIGQFGVRKIDEIAAGRLGDVAQFGVYSVGADIGQMLTGEIGPPINRALLPTLSALQSDPQRMRQAALKTLAVVATVVLPLGAGMALVAQPATAVLLGDKWAAAAQFIAVFALIGAVRVLTGPIPVLLLVMGHSRLQAANTWIEFAVFLAAAALLVPSFGFIGLAYARLVAAVVIASAYFISGRLYAALRFGDYVKAIWRPAVGVALMAAVLLLLFTAVDSGSAPVRELSMRIGVGAFVYIGWIAASWWSVGRPDGIERMVFDRIAAVSADTAAKG